MNLKKFIMYLVLMNFAFSTIAEEKVLKDTFEIEKKGLIPNTEWKKNVLGKALLLVPDKKYKITSIQCLSNVSSNYSNNNKSLYSVSSNDHNAKKETIIKEFTKITKIQQSEMQLIKSYRIKKALHKNIYKIDRKDNIYFCGDWQKEPSIDGALKSGRLTAEKIINICKT